MNVQPGSVRAFIDASADVVAREIATLRRDAERERALWDAEMRARMAEWDARITALAAAERKVDDLAASVKDGKDGADGRDGRDGDSIHPDEVRAMLAELVAEISAPQDGKDGRDGADGRDGKDGKDGERGPEGPAGKMPVAVVWSDRVHYEGEVATHQGAAWQAIRDTGHEPPHADWICLAARGLDGAEGRSFLPRGLFDAQEEYRALDVVTINASSFVANRDNPGECPGEGWFLLAGQGKRGKPGERGEIGLRGIAGERAEAVVSLTVNDDGVMTLVNGDGSIIECDLYPVLSRVK